MEVKIFDSYEDMSIAAAALVAEQIRRKADANIGVPTGSTPIAMYKELVRMHKEEELDFALVRFCNLDEYIGLAPDHPQSYAYFMHEHLYNHINVDDENCNIPSGIDHNPQEQADIYELFLHRVPRDIQILGIGRNAHIGFNEPSDVFTAETHVVTLAESTIEANKRFFRSKDEVPRQAITMGMRQILAAKQIILLASGEAKAEAIKKMLYGNVDPRIPASILNLHDNVLIMLDKEAAGNLA